MARLWIEADNYVLVILHIGKLIEESARPKYFAEMQFDTQRTCWNLESALLFLEAQVEACLDTKGKDDVFQSLRDFKQYRDMVEKDEPNVRY